VEALGFDGFDGRRWAGRFAFAEGDGDFIASGAGFVDLRLVEVDQLAELGARESVGCSRLGKDRAPGALGGIGRG